MRSTQRIVAGAGAFQLGDKKLMTTSQHNATGPPLKTFVFDAIPDRLARQAAYVEHTIKALKHVSATLGDLDLHDRVAIVVPDDEYASHFRDELAPALLAAYPWRRYRLIDAREAATVVVDSDSDAWLIVDSVENIDGLERICVVCVDLDTVIEQSDALATRSLIYRAMTRAHMIVVVVNEFLEGGWLAFMRTLKLEEEAKEKKARGKFFLKKKAKEEARDKTGYNAKDRGAVERTTAGAKVTAVLREADDELMAQAAVATLLSKAVELRVADAGLPLLDEHILAHTPAIVDAWGALWQACMQAAEAKLRAKTGEQSGEAILRDYTLDAASSIVRGAEGRLPTATGAELVAAAEAAVEVSLAQAKGWRTPAFYAQCREAALAIGWETSDEDWRTVPRGGKDVGWGIQCRLAGRGGFDTMPLDQAVREAKAVYDELLRLLEEKGLEERVVRELHGEGVSKAGCGKDLASNLPLLVDGLVEAREAEREESLGVQRQLVWDVESTAQAPLGELKFTPYPTEKRRVEWLDSDGDSVGFELVGTRMYYLVYGKRYAPRGPAHVVEYLYPDPSRGEGWFRFVDSRSIGIYIGNTIPPDKVAEVQAMWDIAKAHV